MDLQQQEKHQLPGDMLMEVFSFLPAKELCKLRCLSKDFKSCSTTTFFSHLQSIRSRPDCGVISQCYYGYIDLFFLDLFSGVPKEAVDLLRRTGAATRILGSANGLVVFETADEKDDHNISLSLYNLATMSFKCLSHPTGSRLYNSGIAMVFEKEHCKLVYITPTMEWEPFMECWIYSTMEGTWKKTKKMGTGPRDLKFDRPVIIDGIIYLVSNCHSSFRKINQYIVAVDVENERSEILHLPGGAASDVSKGDDVEVGRWNGVRTGMGSLCLVRWCNEDLTFRIWRLKNMNKWIWSDGCRQVSLKSIGLEGDEIRVGAFTVIEETLVFAVLDVVYAYGLKDGELRRMKGEMDFHPRSLYSYANTLHPCY